VNLLLRESRVAFVYRAASYWEATIQSRRNGPKCEPAQRRRNARREKKQKFQSFRGVGNG